MPSLSTTSSPHLIRLLDAPGCSVSVEPGSCSPLNLNVGAISTFEFACGDSEVLSAAVSTSVAEVQAGLSCLTQDIAELFC
jgi:hypothetical protein